MTRAHKGWALDTVTIHNEVLRQTKEEITSPPAVGAAAGTVLGLGVEVKVSPGATGLLYREGFLRCTQETSNQSRLHLPGKGSVTKPREPWNSPGYFRLCF